MNNEMHGLCSKCIQNFNPQTPVNISYTCQKCNQSQGQFIWKDSVVCLRCYQRQKQSFSILKKNSSQLKMSSLLTLVPKSEMNSSSINILSKNGKVIKKLQKLLTSYEIKSNQIVNQLKKKCIVSSNNVYSWQKIAQKCHKTASLIYFFVGKEIIFGAFHTQAVKIANQNSFIEDVDSGIFYTERAKYDLNIYKTSKNIVRYSHKSKSIVFGEPAAFQINFGGKEIILKSEIPYQLKWDYFFIYKL